MKTQKIITIVGILSLIFAASFWYSQNHGLLPVAASEEADLYDGLFNALLAIATGLFLLIQGILIFSLIKFRRQAGDTTDGPPIHDNFLLEMIWTALPTVTVIWVALSSFDVYNVMHYGRPAASTPLDAQALVSSLSIPEAKADSLPGTTPPKAEPKSPDLKNRLPNPFPQLDPSAAPSTSEKAMEIEVSGMQYAWIFTYPGTDVVTSELHVPLGRKIKLDISAQDVIHSFWVPQFRLKQDAIPGRNTYMEFTASKIGEYPVVCAELCGSYHGGMRTQVIVQTPEDYEAWLQEEQATASADPQRIATAIHNSASTMTDSEFLAERDRDLKQQMGINPEILEQVHNHNHHAGHLMPL